jgi:hypothetical protein
VCPTDGYDGLNFFLNILSGSVASAGSNVANTNPGTANSKSTAAELYSYLFHATSGVGQSSNTLAVNALVSTSLNTLNDGCGACIHALYQAMLVEITSDDTFWAGGSCSIKTDAVSGSTPSEVALLADTTIWTIYNCIKPLQAAIDSFHACASNGLSVLTGASIRECTTDEFLDFDVQFRVYDSMMNKSLFGVEFVDDFHHYANSILCGSCFYDFGATILAASASLSGTCGSSIYGYGCLESNGQLIRIAFAQLEACSGLDNSLIQTDNLYIASDTAVLLNKALRLFSTVASCAAQSSSLPSSSGGGWESCVRSATAYSPLMSTVTDGMLSCYRIIADEAYLNVLDGCADPWLAGLTGCVAKISARKNPITDVIDSTSTYSNSALDDFYRCAGFQLDVTPTQCSPSEQLTIPRSQKTLWGAMKKAVAASSYTAAAGDVWEFPEMKVTLGDLPCFSCYAAFAAEIRHLLTTDQRTVCDESNSARFNRASCVGFQPVMDSLARFNTCAGFALLDTLPPSGLTTECSQAEFFAVDATYSSYTKMMKRVLFEDETGYGEFEDAFTRLPCRNCFYEFMTSIARERASLITPCGDGNTIYSVGSDGTNCMDTMPGSRFVLDALQEFRECSKNRINTIAPYTASGDQILFFEDTIRLYNSVVNCGILRRLRGGEDPQVLGWNRCLREREPLFRYGSYGMTQDLWNCLSGVGAAAYGTDAVCGDSTQNELVYSSACVDRLNTTTNSFDSPPITSSLLTFHQCSGYAMNTASTLCSEADIAALPVNMTSFVPFVETAMRVADPIEAARAVMANADYASYWCPLPCGSCFARLAAELNLLMSTDDKTLCRNPYTDICASGATLSLALTRFTECSGMELDNRSPYQCKQTEWDSLVLSGVVATTMDLLRGSVGTSLGAVVILIQKIQETIPSSAQNEFRCIPCFLNIVAEFTKLETSAACESDVFSAACLSAGGYLPLVKFEACSGFSIDV